MGALARPVGEADQLLLPFGCRANHDKNTLLLILEPRLQVDAVRPDVNIAPGREIALLPAFVFFGPPLLQPRAGRCRQAGRILAEQRRQRLPEVTGRDALQVKDRDQHLQTSVSGLVSVITGQSRAMVAHYARQVNQKKLAAAAVLKWEAAGEQGAH